jgi:hypothetical protein
VLEEKLLMGKAREESHSVINADEKVPNLVWFISQTRSSVLEKLKCDEHTVYI